MRKAKTRSDPEFTKLVGQHIVNAKGFLDYGVKNGLTSPKDLRLTIEKRREEIKALIDSGMSQRQVAKAVGVNQSQVSRGLSDAKRIKNDAKRIKRKANACDAPDFPEHEDGMSDSEIAIFHIRYCASTAADRAGIARKEMAKADRNDITDKVVSDARNTARLWDRLASDLSKRGVQEESHVDADNADKTDKSSGRNGAAPTQQAAVD